MLNRCCDDFHTIQLTCIKSSYSTSEYFNFEFSSRLWFQLRIISETQRNETHTTSVYFIEIMLKKSESYFIKKSKHPLKDVCFLLPLHVCKRHSCIHLAYELIFMFTHISLSGKQWVNRLYLFSPVCAVSWSIFTVLDGNIQNKSDR